MQDLIEKLERLSEPAPMLHGLIAVAAGHAHMVNPKNPEFADMIDPEYPNFPPGPPYSMAPAYTSSIDAALTLVPEGFEPHRIAFPHGKGRTFCFEIFPPSDDPAWSKGSICERGNTAPLAICIAALRARVAVCAC